MGPVAKKAALTDAVACRIVVKTPPLLLSQAAGFVLFTATARTRIVATDFLFAITNRFDSSLLTGAIGGVLTCLALGLPVAALVLLWWGCLVWIFVNRCCFS